MLVVVSGIVADVIVVDTNRCGVVPKVCVVGIIVVIGTVVVVVVETSKYGIVPKPSLVELVELVVVVLPGQDSLLVAQIRIRIRMLDVYQLSTTE